MRSIQGKSTIIRQICTWLPVLLLFLAGGLIRIYDLGDLPLDTNATRQMHSYLRARGMYYAGLETATPSVRDTALAQERAVSHVEPPVMETLAVLGYRLLGGEALWFPRLLSIILWLAGGFALYAIARVLTSHAGGLVSLGVYLLLPFGIYNSRVFQPDPLMVCLSLFALWMALEWRRKGGWQHAILAGLLAGAAIAIKNTAVFMLLGGFAGLALSRGVKACVRDARVWVMALLSALPTLGIFACQQASGVNWQSSFAVRFFPSMWKDPVFYLHWLEKIDGAVGMGLFCLALIGIALFAKPEGRNFILGQWAGYVVFGMLFAYHFSTHTYYQLPLVPLTALSLAPLAEMLHRRLGETRLRLFWRTGIALSLALLVVFTLWGVRTQLRKTDYRPQAAFYQEVVQALPPHAKVMALSEDYASRLAFWGWIVPDAWPYTGDYQLKAIQGFEQKAMREEFQKRTNGETVFVITDLVELERQPLLRDYLEEHYPLLADANGYLIYNLKEMLPGVQ